MSELPPATTVLSVSTKRARKELSLKEKYELIKEFENTPVTQSKLSEKYNIGRTTVSDILKRKGEYKSYFGDGINLDANSIRVPHLKTRYEDIEKLLNQWVKQSGSSSVPRYVDVKEKALQFAAELGHEGFRGSKWWFEAWRSRYTAPANEKDCGVLETDCHEQDGHFEESMNTSLHAAKRMRLMRDEDLNVKTLLDTNGQQNSICIRHESIFEQNNCTVKNDNISSFLSNTNHMPVNFDSEDIFCVKETGLLFKALPDSLTLQNIDTRSGELSTERLTILLACSNTGERLKPLLIGNNHHNSCFKNFDTDTLPVIWRTNERSWITEDIFKEWITEIDEQMVLQNRKITMFLELTSSHSVSLKLKNINLKFLLGNGHASSVVHPLDCGIIKEFKTHYRKHLFKHSLAKLNTYDENVSSVKSINIIDPIYWISKSWRATKVRTIVNGFRNAGFSSFPDILDEEEGSEDSDAEVYLVRLWNLIEHSQHNFDHILMIETNLPTENPNLENSEDEITRNVKIELSDENDNEYGLEENADILSHEEMLRQINKMIKFSLTKDSRYVDSLLELKMLTEETIVCNKFT